MSIFTAELIGTALLILLGNGVVSSCVLKQTHAVGIGVGWTSSPPRGDLPCSWA